LRSEGLFAQVRWLRVLLRPSNLFFVAEIFDNRQIASSVAITLTQTLMGTSGVLRYYENRRDKATSNKATNGQSVTPSNTTS